MRTAIPVRWLEATGWLVGINLTASGSGVGSGTFNVQGLPQLNAKNAEGVVLPDSLSSLRSFAAIVLRHQRVVRVHSSSSRSSARVPRLILSLSAFARRAPQQRDLADRSHIKDMNPVPGIDDRRVLLLRQKDLLGVFHGNRLAIHSNLERTERACLQSGFQVGEFHPGKSKPGRSEGKPQPVRRIEKTDRLKNGASGTRRTSFASFVCFCEEKVGSGEGCFSQKATKATKSSTSLMAARERKDRKETPEICSDDGNPKHWLVLRNMRTHFADTSCDPSTL